MSRKAWRIIRKQVSIWLICVCVNVFSGVSCADHVLSTVLKRMMWPYKKDRLLVPFPAEDRAHLETAKKVWTLSKTIAQAVRCAFFIYMTMMVFFSQSKLEEDLPAAKVDCPTRWLTKLYTVEWAKDNNAVLLRRGHSALYDDYFTEVTFSLVFIANF